MQELKISVMLSSSLFRTHQHLIIVFSCYLDFLLTKVADITQEMFNFTDKQHKSLESTTNIRVLDSFLTLLYNLCYLMKTF